MLFKVRKPIYTEELSQVWEKVPLKIISILNINLRGTDVVISPQRQFDRFYKDRSLIAETVEEAEEMFLMVLFSTKCQLIIRQIELAESRLLDRISDLNIWADVTTISGSNTNNRTSVTDSDGVNKNRSAATDSNSLMAKDIIAGHFNLEENSPITPNQLSENITQDTSKITNKDDGSSNMNSTTHFSNESKDIIEFLKLDVEDLRQKFWAQFHCLFSY